MPGARGQESQTTTTSTLLFLDSVRGVREFTFRAGRAADWMALPTTPRARNPTSYSGAEAFSPAGAFGSLRDMNPVTIEQLQSREHQLHAYCPACDRWKVLNLDEMLTLWRALEHAPTEVQCTECGHFGLLRVRNRVAPSSDAQHADVTDRALTG